MTTISPSENNERRARVSKELAMMLDRLLRNQRTFDGAELTDGDVIVALGYLIGQHVRDPAKITKWMQEIAVAAHAASTEEKQ